MATITPRNFFATFATSQTVRFGPRTVASLNLSKADADWLTKVGLPKDAAPCLSFGGPDEHNLPLVDNYYGRKGIADKRYRVIGTSGEGDPVVIDTDNRGAVLYLIHDDHFKTVSINSSIRQLATCLVAYAKLVTATQAENGEDAFMNNNVPEPLIREFESVVERVDSDAARADTMWSREIERLRAGPYAG